MKIIKLNAIDSTNTYLKSLSKNLSIEDATVVLTNNQTEGRGQMGANWESKPGQSLTFSVFKRFRNLDISEQAKISFGVSLGIRNALEKLFVPKLSIKWPNDIMSDKKKLCGVLIENMLDGDRLNASIVGVGINVNDSEFQNLPMASSMRLASGQQYDLDEVFHTIIEEVLNQLNLIDTDDSRSLKEAYENKLFRKDQVSTFHKTDGEKFNGIIRGVTNTGELRVENEDHEFVEFELKQIKLLF